uniref:G-protein coupled receptors family 1 profile domain-containing protein n=1 Tax=Takifugu rubripes TaxID=31033 RepID=A0A674NZQ2_TAKRU
TKSLVRTDLMFLFYSELFCMDLHLFHNRSDVFEDHCNESSSRFGITNIVSPYLLCAIFGLLSVITVCGNLLVITAILYFRQLHSPTHYLILSLAVADLLVGVLVLPFSAVLIVEPCFYLQTFICQVRNSCDMFLSTTSILNLCFISLDRYHAVCQPLKYRMIINVRVTVRMIVVSWTLPVLIGIGEHTEQVKKMCNVPPLGHHPLVGHFIHSSDVSHYLAYLLIKYFL